MKTKRDHSVGWFGAVDSKSAAAKTLSDASLALYALAATQIMIGYFIGDGAVVEGMLFAVIGYLLTTMNPRAIGRVLLVVSGFMIVVSAAHAIRIDRSGLDHLAIGLITLWISLRVIRASRALRVALIDELRQESKSAAESEAERVARYG